MSCLYDVTSEEYADFILSTYAGYTIPENSSEATCIEPLNEYFSILYSPVPEHGELFPISGAIIPSLYTLMDSTSTSIDDLSQSLPQPLPNFSGQGTIIGFIDTGIDYRNPMFQNYDGSSRIISIWDQSLSADPGSNVPYGRQFQQANINQALASPNPLDIVPSADSNGHGTFMAAIAAGYQPGDPEFTGSAPRCSIAMVKLKPAKQLFRDFYCIQESAIAYQENDIMQGVQYLVDLAAQHNKPLVIYIGLGTNYGSHEGNSPLCILLKRISQQIGIVTVLAAGNETGLEHHHHGFCAQGDRFQDVDILVGEHELGFVAQIWAASPEEYSVGFLSPGGHVVRRVPVHYQSGISKYVLADHTSITVRFFISELGKGSQCIFVQIKNPTPGLWKMRIYNNLSAAGDYHIWLPIDGFITKETKFLEADPNTVITEPGNTHAALTIGAYNHYNDSIYTRSSRGYSRDLVVKPDITAPGVNIKGPGLSNDPSASSAAMQYQSGTSVAAAHTAGAVANLLTWGIVNQNQTNLTSALIKTILIKSADRITSIDFPNREWSYGLLNLYQAFAQLSE